MEVKWVFIQNISKMISVDAINLFLTLLRLDHADASNRVERPEPHEELPGPRQLGRHLALPHLILHLNLPLQHDPLRLHLKLLSLLEILLHGGGHEVAHLGNCKQKRDKIQDDSVFRVYRLHSSIECFI